MVRKTLAALGIVAMSVVVRCGDHDDDDEKYEHERRSALTGSAYAQATPPALVREQR